MVFLPLRLRGERNRFEALHFRQGQGAEVDDGRRLERRAVLASYLASVDVMIAGDLVR